MGTVVAPFRTVVVVIVRTGGTGDLHPQIGVAWIGDDINAPDLRVNGVPMPSYAATT